MNDKKNNQTKTQKEDKPVKEKNKLDRELNQSFPASDPPCCTRPGHERKDEKDT